MLSLSCFFISTTTYPIFLSVHPLFWYVTTILLHFKGDFIMDKYLNSFRDMISLRGLAEHTLINYCTYIRAYLDYLSGILHMMPEEVSWDELRDYIRWLQKSRAFLTELSTVPSLNSVFYHLCPSLTLGWHSASFPQIWSIPSLCPLQTGYLDFHFHHPWFKAEDHDRFDVFLRSSHWWGMLSTLWRCWQKESQAPYHTWQEPTWPLCHPFKSGHWPAYTILVWVRKAQGISLPQTEWTGQAHWHLFSFQAYPCPWGQAGLGAQTYLSFFPACFWHPSLWGWRWPAYH